MPAPERPVVIRRRRTALGAVAALALVAGAVVGGDDDDEDGERAAAPGPPSPTCPTDVVAAPRRLAGQMLVVRMEAEASAELQRRVRRGELGGVILFPPVGVEERRIAVEIAKLGDAAAAGGLPPPIVAVDQEGGEVKRFPDLPPDRSAMELAAGDPAAATAEGEATGRRLASLGVNVDLAPVLDVPGVPDAFIASRAYGSDPAAVAEVGLGFAGGLGDGGVAATAKHFPGLGLAVANTDLGSSVIAASRAELAPGLAPFEAAIDAGLPLIMVANATYPAYDGRRPAALAPRIVSGLLRERLGFEGVIVTDDLGAGAIAGAGIDEGEAATAAAGAGADLLLFALSDGGEAHRELIRAIRRRELDVDALAAGCARNFALRERFASARPTP